MATYLDFELKIKTLQENIATAQLKGDTHAIEILQKDLEKEVERVYSNLSDYQKLQLARHPDRPYAMDYIGILLKDSIEIHGDRHFSDDNAIVCFLGKIDHQKVMVIGEEKGRGTKNKLQRNFGMPNPEGYRKALRVAKMAEKFEIPLLMFVDTPGAYPGVGAEERGQSEAIAKNLQEFSQLKIPTISIVIGEGGSGGALAISVADRLAMMEYSVFSVISPEGCAAILWNDPSKIENATQALKITPNELKAAKLIDDIIKEPIIGAHRDKEGAAQAIKEYFLNSLKEIQNDKNYLQTRYDKLMSYGSFQ
ncbi:acetyl-CoA carboxylase carboxyl transferase subunit alpha [Helicobacter pullorum]|mgnify:FL=1|uniref:Acetyl-coenzyme A carboxylase carboxyl transferase subunit alpha n=2 Tax=Helicobacter pullorum TaxID=35818 RepID=A0A0N1E6C9_9HELI|nr:acetyl-CoA carboxylase carboxyl transferase subunit alpha [Helicobacter pullorum]KAB0575153.1 acetyl-CoA carboxylase carboxyl transferase subunit alpha [Helicobacter pullorum NCTC 12824]HIS08793.1 acetyl-CoA carboxylase carboxyl transferase subunit alpha [Candidatus Scatomorpha intestinipullorum]EEQ63462.1 acetyl-CoA carboxylase, carboxyl transferase, alpha subunit [Helicobacter pullorum MIT 98-5489]KPH50545.1 acetyl-CoA carboxylase subunit alpha [Helicobacter pullorum]KPH52630.1 acetyl-CoA